MRSLLFVAGLSLLALAIGCGPNDKPKPPVLPAGNDHGHDHGHDHDHHDHEHIGLHGGRVIVAGAKHVEVMIDDKAGKVTFWVLDETMKKEVPIAATELVVDVVLPGKDKVEYKIPAVAAAAEGKASKFEATDKALATAVEVGSGATLHIEIDGKKHDLKLEAEEHDHKH